jgi:hypothetical protein
MYTGALTEEAGEAVVDAEAEDTVAEAEADTEAATGDLLAVPSRHSAVSARSRSSEVIGVRYRCRRRIGAPNSKVCETSPLLAASSCCGRTGKPPLLAVEKCGCSHLSSFGTACLCGQQELEKRVM